MQIPYINIHTHSESCPESLSIVNYSALDRPTVYTQLHSVGIHPYDAHKPQARELVATLADSHPVSIGEAGLDFSIGTDKNLQISIFEAQCQLANLNNLPLIIHSVKATDTTLSILREIHSPIIIHGFTGNRQSAWRFLDHGHYLSFGHRTLRSPKTLDALNYAPQDRIFFETDAYPMQISQLYAIFAESLKQEVDTLKTKIYNNYKTIFETR